MKKLTLLFIVVMLLNILCGCGLKGPLYIPDKSNNKININFLSYLRYKH